MSQLSDFVLIRLGAESPPIPLEKKTMLVGRNITADIIIKSPYCSRKHCSLTVTAGGVYLEDTSRFGTFINKDRIHAKGRALALNDYIGFGCVTTMNETDMKLYSDDIFAYKLEKRTVNENSGPDEKNAANETVHFEELVEKMVVQPAVVDNPAIPSTNIAPDMNEAESDNEAPSSNVASPDKSPIINSVDAGEVQNEAPNISVENQLPECIAVHSSVDELEMEEMLPLSDVKKALHLRKGNIAINMLPPGERNDTAGTKKKAVKRTVPMPKSKRGRPARNARMKGKGAASKPAT